MSLPVSIVAITSFAGVPTCKMRSLVNYNQKSLHKTDFRSKLESYNFKAVFCVTSRIELFICL